MFIYLKKKIVLVCLFLLACPFAFAQIDSLNQLEEVQVVALPEQKATPVQTIGLAGIEKLQALQVSDAVKYFSGVIVKDYGGIGGLKTVSVRGLGPTHTGISYDGITVNDSQTGQIDIGKFSLDNIETISLTKGSPDNIFQPARIFSSASLLSIKTLEPQFKDGDFFKGRFFLKTGSFGLINPSLLFQNKICKKITTSVNVEGQKANGRYPFIFENGSSTSKQTRGNTDVESFRGEGNIFTNFSNSYRLFLKTSYYQSERGLPGATILYNSESSQRLWDKIFFIQSGLDANLSEKVSGKINAKYYSSFQKYLNPDHLGMEGKVENEYFQREAYFSVSGLIKASRALHFSAASDWVYNTMEANLRNFAYPTRHTFLSVVNAKWETNKFSLIGNVLSTVVKEDVQEGNKPKDKERFSPSITIGYKPGNGKLLLRFFYKDIYRLPTFNDLYYTGIGNTKLKPESAQQFNIGATFLIPSTKKQDFVYLTADFYHNKVANKIVALPTRNLFIWSMLNLGKVKINGADFSVKSTIDLVQNVVLSFDASYTFQHVRDMTNPSGKTYKNQVAYTPVHSGSSAVGINSKWINVSYNFIFSGSRYILNQNVPANYLKGYSEHGISAGRNISIGKVETGIKLEMLNILNTQYEVVNNFPMPGRSARLTLSARI